MSSRSSTKKGSSSGRRRRYALLTNGELLDKYERRQSRGVLTELLSRKLTPAELCRLAAVL